MKFYKLEIDSYNDRIYYDRDMEFDTINYRNAVDEYNKMINESDEFEIELILKIYDYHGIHLKAEHLYHSRDKKATYDEIYELVTKAINKSEKRENDE